MRLELWELDPDRHYPPHLLVTDQPDTLRLEVDLGAGVDLRLALAGRPHAAVAYILGSTYREEGGLRAAYCPLIAFEEIPDEETLLGILNCCKWSERLIDSDWVVDGQRHHVFACRLTERYLLEFVHGVYDVGGLVIPGHLGDRHLSDGTPPYHVDLAQGRALGLDGEAVAEIRRRYSRGLTAAIVAMPDPERSRWGLPPGNRVEGSTA